MKEEKKVGREEKRKGKVEEEKIRLKLLTNRKITPRAQNILVYNH
jgi:hypothetical protein